MSPTSGRLPGRSRRRRPPPGRGSRSPTRASGSRRTCASLSAELAEPLRPARATSPTTRRLTRCSTAIEREFGGLDFLVHGAAFAPREELSAPFVQTSREGFRVALDISAYSLVALSRARAAADGARGGGSILTLTYLGSQRVFHELQRHGRGQGGARSDGPLPRRAISGRRTSASTPSRRGPSRPSRPRASPASRASCRCTATARRCGAHVETSEVAEAALFLLGPGGRAITGEVLIVDGGFHAIGHLVCSGTRRRK